MKYKSFSFALFIILQSNIFILSQPVQYSFVKAMALYKQGKYKEAIPLFSECIEDDNTNHTAYFRRSYSYYYLGDFKKALADIERAFEVAPRDHRYYYMKGLFYDKLKNYDLTEYYLDMAIRYQPERFYYYQYRAAFHLENGKYDRALRDFNVLIAINPFDYRSYYGRGLAKYNLKMRPEACLDWLYGREHNKSCNTYFFYKCTDLDLRGKSVKPVSHSITVPPQFMYESDTSLAYYLATTAPYSQKSFMNDEEASLILKFVITAEKKIQDIQVLYSTNNNFDSLALRSLQQSEKYWIKPGYLEDEAIDFTYYLPISYKMSATTIKIPALMDSLSYYSSKKDYNKIYDLSDSILLRNPFMIEALNYKRESSKVLGIHCRNCDDSWLYSFNSKSSEIHNEVWVMPDYSKIYYNDIWQITDPSSANYIRIIKGKVPMAGAVGSFTDYTIDGKIFCTGSYYFGYKQNDFNFYYPNGNLKCHFRYWENQLIDTSKYYYENGSLRHTIIFSKGDFKVLAYFDSTGTNLLPGGTGKWEFSMPDYLNEKTIKVSGELKNYMRDGIWRCSIDSVTIVEEKYKRGDLVSGYYFEDGKKMEINGTFIKSWLLVPFSLGRAEQMEYESKNKNKGFRVGVR